MSDTQPAELTAGQRDAQGITDDVEDFGEDLFDLTGEEIPDELDVEGLDDLVAATPTDVDHAPYDEVDEEQA